MTSDTGWSRKKALAVLAGAGAGVLVVIAGAALAVYFALTQEPEAPEAAASEVQATAGTGQQWRDQVAAEPMLEIVEADVTGGSPALTVVPVIEIPLPTETGLARIPTGFPRTPEGAAGQLAAILTDVVHVMSIAHTHAVYDAWSHPDATPAEEWAMTRNVADFISAAGLPGQAAGDRARIHATPVAGQIKGVDGDDWALVCVLLTIRAVVDVEAEVAYGHCERMRWQRGRWVIDEGPAPAPAPSTWAGTERAAEAGWLTWRPTTP